MSVCSSLIAIVDTGGHQAVQISRFSLLRQGVLDIRSGAIRGGRSYHILLEPAHTILAHASLSVLLRSTTKSTDIGY